MKRAFGVRRGRENTLGILLLAFLGPACAASPPPPAAAPEAEVRSAGGLEAALQALSASRYEEAEKKLRVELEGSSAKEARLALAELYLDTGRYDEALDSLREISGGGRVRLLRGRALRARGRVEEAESMLKESSRETDVLLRAESAVLLGEIRLELGKRSEAEEPLLSVIELYNRDQFARLEPDARALGFALVGRAAHLLRAPEDANEAFDEAEQIGTLPLRALLFRAELFLEKFNLGQAEQVTLDVLRRAPEFADALVTLAEIRLEQSLAFDEAEKLARRALRVNPAHPRARFVLAGIALRDLDIALADEEVTRGLQTNPRDLSLLSMKAAVRFLAEDPEGFERVVDHVQELSPGYARLFDVVRDYAEWEHRYEDIEKLLRRAVRLDREDGRIRGHLGLTLVRSGSDAAGIVELRQAFELDPYNVRVLNTLELYEKQIPRGYDEVRQGPFVFRFPKAERALLERYLPPLLDQAHQVMVRRYGYTPRAPLGMEIYATKDQFAVRTTGLPEAGIAGVCFGRKVATVSPRGQNANLGMTLWHELSHVFHIGLSESRVPRFLTEGLAEWETAHLDRGWSRELDLELYRFLREDRLPSLGAMTRAFTRAESMEEISVAYHMSKRLADWIVKTRGEESAVRLLREFGKKRLPNAVIPEVLGAEFRDLDVEFRAWLRQELGSYGRQFVSRFSRGSVEELKKRAEEKDASSSARLDLGLALLRAGQLDEAEKIFEELLTERFEPEVGFSLARVLLARGERDTARRLLERLITEGHDGYEVRMVLARLFTTWKKWSEVIEQTGKATHFDPSQVDAWLLRAAAANEVKQTEIELASVMQAARLSEHDAEVHQRAVTLLLDAGRFEDAARFASDLIWAGLGKYESHFLAARAFSRAGQRKQAEFEWESAALLAQTERDRQRIREAREGAR